MQQTRALLLILLLSVTHCSRPARLPESGPYLGQQPPDTTAALFAPGIVSTGLFTRDIAITPDGHEIYFSVLIGGTEYTAILVTRQVHGRWTRPEVTPFSENPAWWDGEPCISPDGAHFYFMSNRPDTAAGETDPGDPDIWGMERTGDGWSAPRNLGAPVNSAGEEYFPSVTRDGTMYFTRQDAGSPIGYIYRSQYVDGAYQAPERLPETVNAGRSQYNAFVAPDESYLIIPIYGLEDSFGATDYYISFRDDSGAWTQAINMGEPVNSSARGEYSPYVSPDGRYFFFMSDRYSPPVQPPERLTYQSLENLSQSPANGNANIYWMDAGIIEDLRTRAMQTQ